MLSSITSKVPGVQQRTRMGAVACGSPCCRMSWGSPVGVCSEDLAASTAFLTPLLTLGAPGSFLARSTHPWGLAPTETSGYILGWLQEAEVEALAGPSREAVKALARMYAEGRLASEPSDYQLRTVYPVLAAMAPKVAAKMQRQVQAIGTPGEKAAVRTAMLQAREAGIPGASRQVPIWLIVAGAAAGIGVLGLAAWALLRGGGE